MTQSKPHVGILTFHIFFFSHNINSKIISINYKSDLYTTETHDFRKITYDGKCTKIEIELI